MLRPSRSSLAGLAALLAGSALGLVAGCSMDCSQLHGGALGSVLCGGAGTEAPEPALPQPSACQPRAVMPQFYALLDAKDASFEGLREAVSDLAVVRCLTPDAQRACTSDDQCSLGHCAGGLCPCTTPYSPLSAVLGAALRGLGAIAQDGKRSEPGATGSPGCLSPEAAASLPDADRSRLCELRRTLDVLLQQSGGQQLLDDPDVRRVLLSLLDYVQGKTDGRQHYDLFLGLGRMASLDSPSCDPSAIWQLADAGLACLTPQRAQVVLGQLQVLLADPYTKQFLATLTAGGGTETGRDAVIVLLHTLTPSLLAARSGSEALAAVDPLLSQLVYGSSSVPQSFKDEVAAVRASLGDLLADSTGVFPPMQKLLACASSPEVRCADPSRCTVHDDELVGALYDLLSRPELDGGLDLATLVGAGSKLATLDPTGQVSRTLRMIARGVLTPDESGGYPTRDAIAALAHDALTPAEAQKLLPAVSVLIDRRVVVELFTLLQDLLYTCQPPVPRSASSLGAR